MKKRRVGVIDSSLVLCLVTSGGEKRKAISLVFSEFLGPLAILSNSLLFLLPNNSNQRGLLCGLLIQVPGMQDSVSLIELKGGELSRANQFVKILTKFVLH